MCPTVRALVMVLAYMLALLIDRPREAIASLALAAIVICVALPGSTADIGFQLSFASVIAIVIGMRRFAAWIARRKRLGRLPAEPTARFWTYAEMIPGYLAVSFWAMLGTAPLTAFHFNQFAIVGLRRQRGRGADHGVRRNRQRTDRRRDEFLFGAGCASDSIIGRERARSRQLAGGVVRRFAVGVVPHFHPDNSRTHNGIRIPDALAARAARHSDNRKANDR